MDCEATFKRWLKECRSVEVVKSCAAFNEAFRAVRKIQLKLHFICMFNRLCIRIKIYDHQRTNKFETRTNASSTKTVENASSKCIIKVITLTHFNCFYAKKFARVHEWWLIKMFQLWNCTIYCVFEQPMTKTNCFKIESEVRKKECIAL